MTFFFCYSDRGGTRGKAPAPCSNFPPQVFSLAIAETPVLAGTGVHVGAASSPSSRNSTCRHGDTEAVTTRAVVLSTADGLYRDVCPPSVLRQSSVSPPSVLRQSSIGPPSCPPTPSSCSTTETELPPATFKLKEASTAVVLFCNLQSLESLYVLT